MNSDETAAASRAWLDEHNKGDADAHALEVTARDLIADLRYGTVTAPAVKMTRPESSRFDPLGRTLTVDDHLVGTDRVVRLRIESDTRLHVQAYELDADDAVQLAHELLERAYPQADCDEIETAVVALRKLADREEAYEPTGIEMQGLDR